MQNRIFSIDSAKAVKAQEYGYLNAIHYMAPATLAGVGDLCPFRSPSCTAACLGWTSGQAGMVKTDDVINSVRQSRIDKARRFMKDRANYMADVIKSIHKAQAQANRMGLKLCVRLNGSADIGWEGVRVDGKSIFDLFPDVQFVDYTKSSARALRSVHDKAWPKNYHLTFSRSENNEDWAIDVLSRGGNVAVVFDRLPNTWMGYPVIDGDKHDLRHLDPRGVVVGLTPKGRKAKRDQTGFVVRTIAA